MREEQYLRLPSQGNIYSTTRLGNISLIGSGNYGKVFAHIKKSSLEELALTDLPDQIDIIAVDAWAEPFPVIGVTYVDTTNSTLEDEIKPAYLQIFSSLPSSKSTWSWASPDSSSYIRQLDDTKDPKLILTSESCSPPSSVPISSFRYNRSVVDPSVKDKEDYLLEQLKLIGTQPSTIFKLDFIPYHLYHMLAEKVNGEFFPIFLLSGSDHCIHTYEPTIDEQSDSIKFLEVSTRNYFPELPTKFDSIVTRIAVEFVTSTRKRITICGTEDGTLRGYIVPESGIPKWTPLMEESIDSESSATELNSTSITSLNDESSSSSVTSGVIGDKEKMLKLVSSTSSISMTASQQLQDDIIRVVNHYDGMITCIQFYASESQINAVVSSSASPAYHYTNLVDDQFKSGSSLKFSSKWDCVETICVADVDFDGQNEIVIGTFGCTLLVYKYMAEVKNWTIVAHRKFPNAIFSVAFYDYYLHVVTAAGLHLMEYSNASYFLKYGLTVSDKNAEEFTRDHNLQQSIEKMTLNERS